MDRMMGRLLARTKDEIGLDRRVGEPGRVGGTSTVDRRGGRPGTIEIRIVRVPQDRVGR